jgi:hypothetical protein
MGYEADTGHDFNRPAALRNACTLRVGAEEPLYHPIVRQMSIPKAALIRIFLPLQPPLLILKWLLIVAKPLRCLL